MLLSAQVLVDVGSANQYRVAQQARMTQGDPLRMYFRLVDASLDLAVEDFRPPGRRYCPAAGATLLVVLDNIDEAVRVERSATAAFPTQDTSIWYVDLLADDSVAGTVGMALTLTEGAVVRRGRLQAALLVDAQRGGF